MIAQTVQRNVLTVVLIAAALAISTEAAAQARRPAAARPKVDMRPEFDQRRLEVRQQGQRGACQVFAFVGVLEYQLSKRGKPVDLSEQFIMWAANEANALERTDGFNPDFLIAGLKKHGICSESMMPYVPRNETIEGPSDAARRDASSRLNWELESIKHWSSDIGFTDDQMKDLMARLDKRQPVTAPFCWPKGKTDEQIVDSRHFLIDDATDGADKSGHGVILVGYGLDKRAKGGGYFILRNAWGTKFADRGYLGINFEMAKRYGIDAYVVALSEPRPGPR